MTVVVAFFCTDGVVVAGDSMLTPRVGGISVGHHKGVKVEALQGPQLFAFAGDLDWPRGSKSWRMGVTA
jgi:hypothetical protein